MTKLMVSSIALAAALSLSMPLTSANAGSAEKMGASATSEAHLKAKNAYQNALTDCEMLDNPDRRQQCEEKAMNDYEAMKKDIDEGESKY